MTSVNDDNEGGNTWRIKCRNRSSGEKLEREGGTLIITQTSSLARLVSRVESPRSSGRPHAAPRKSLNGNATPESSNPSRRKGDGGRKSAEPAPVRTDYDCRTSGQPVSTKRRTSNIRLACANDIQASRRRYNRCGDGSFSESGEEERFWGVPLILPAATLALKVSALAESEKCGQPQSGIFPEWGRTEGRIGVYLSLSSSSTFPYPSLRDGYSYRLVSTLLQLKSIRMGGSTLVAYRMYVFLNRKKKEPCREIAGKCNVDTSRQIK
jgi:hypothetical protein